MNTPWHNPTAADPATKTVRRMLITAGPTHEPIDAVRYIANRSSGRLGIALADEAAARGWSVTLLLGPTSLTPKDSRVEVVRFRTTADLEGMLQGRFGGCDVLVMAAAVADYRPKAGAAGAGVAGKISRKEGGLTLELESTPDLLGACGASRRAGQVLVGFALEPAARLLASAAAKLKRKGVDLIVANPLETMDAPEVDATVIGAGGVVAKTDGKMTKERFAGWLLDVIDGFARTRGSAGGGQ
ncbi:MAG TPA: phosphopantothenoylcysteine decarboxylase [Phycisphaerales bacterium]|nr:phosphopantothenoylcysteine decarboxylase [Phycisphaerales bacterium]